MKGIINFLIEANKLKETTRTGWIIWRVKNPETIAEHIFRLCLLAWVFSEKKGLNAKVSIQEALAHDLCEVYAGDITPAFYYQNLDVRRKRDREILMKGIRLRTKDRRRRMKIKFEKEKKSLLKLVAPLDKNTRSEIFLRWLDYEKNQHAEGKLVKQLDWFDTLIQSLEYLGASRSGSGWWEIAEERIEDAFLLKFLAVIQQKFYGVKKHYRKNKELEATLEFILLVGKLKGMPRLYWKLRGVRNPETVAGHIFTLTLLAWIFGKKTNRKLNTGKLMKMALCHELSSVFTGDTTAYDRILSGSKKQREEILKRIPRLTKKQKESLFLKDYREEKRSLEKLTSKLGPALKWEILQLWKEYRTKSSPESKFLSQLNVAAVLFQGLLYEKKYKNFSAAPLWEWAFEVTDDPLILEFLEAMKEKFY